MNDKQYMGRVKSLPCSCCGAEGNTEVHHIREGQGMSQKASNWLTVSLCIDCHRGPLGLHGDKTMMRIQKLDELDLLANTIKMLNSV